MTELEHQAQLAKIYTEIEKMRAETSKIQAEARYYPYIMMLGGMGGVAALITAIFGAVKVLA